MAARMRVSDLGGIVLGAEVGWVGVCVVCGGGVGEGSGLLIACGRVRV